MSADDLTILSASPSCIGGGAEKVAHTLHHEYLERGIDSWLAVANRNCNDANVVEIPVDAQRSRWARELIAKGKALARRPGRANRFASRSLRAIAEPTRYGRVLRGHEDFDFPGTAMLPGLVPSTPDVLHLHNLHGAWFDIRALPTLSTRLPTMLTLHDAWLLTGHCAYPLDCVYWKHGCGDCPRLDLYVPIHGDRSASNAAVKRQAVIASRLALACPSRWLLDMVHESGITTDAVDARVIPNGIDTSIFGGGDKAEARAAVGIPRDATVLAFAARGLEGSQYKGFGTLRSALSALAGTVLDPAKTLLLAIGSTKSGENIAGIEVCSVPFVEDPTEMARLYTAADLYVHPARAESFGLAVAEAMACGTPVVAAAVGGIPEIIVDGESGVLFHPDDSDALAKAIRDVLGDTGVRGQMATRGPERIRQRFTLQAQVDAYLAWYHELVDGWESQA